ncbi:MAG TPA: TetR family transcriptional regulator, partial [Acidimicrobiales bacterium]|nr:TetR family transcriptional regulator [Acidimicrobiales bacterium]
MSEPIGLRERKKRDRRRQIEDVAIELFEQQGFDATTIEQIAAAAEIAPRTFFSYFETKDDVVLADYADRLGRILDELDQRPADEPTW